METKTQYYLENGKRMMMIKIFEKNTIFGISKDLDQCIKEFNRKERQERAQMNYLKGS